MSAVARAIRISSLPGYARCPGSVVLRDHKPSAPGGAANTGTAAGRLIELWHRAGAATADVAACARSLSQVRHEMRDAPGVVWDDLAPWVAGYCGDPRNATAVVAEHCELEVRLALDPAPEDMSQAPVHLVGHLDQIRRDESGGLRVWDVKSGRPSGLELLYGHAWQIAAYALAATATLGEEVLPGGIIRLRGYGKRCDPPTALVHFHAPWTLEQCREMLLGVVQHIAWVRNGLIHLHPGVHCSWCVAGGPHLCSAMLDELCNDSKKANSNG